MRTGEKIAIKIFKVLNSIGILKPQRPLPVSTLAELMINKIKENKKAEIKTFIPYRECVF